MELIINFLKKYYRVDYLAYFIVAGFLTQIMFTFCHMFKVNIIYYIISIIFILICIFGKEFIWDKLLHKGTFEWTDIIFGCIGVVLVIIQWLLLLI